MKSQPQQMWSPFDASLSYGRSTTRPVASTSPAMSPRTQGIGCITGVNVNDPYQKGYSSPRHALNPAQTLRHYSRSSVVGSHCHVRHHSASQRITSYHIPTTQRSIASIHQHVMSPGRNSNTAPISPSYTCRRGGEANSRQLTIQPISTPTHGYPPLQQQHHIESNYSYNPLPVHHRRSQLNPQLLEARKTYLTQGSSSPITRPALPVAPRIQYATNTPYLMKGLPPVQQPHSRGTASLSRIQQPAFCFERPPKVRRASLTDLTSASFQQRHGAASLDTASVNSMHKNRIAWCTEVIQILPNSEFKDPHHSVSQERKASRVSSISSICSTTSSSTPSVDKKYSYGSSTSAERLTVTEFPNGRVGGSFGSTIDCPIETDTVSLSSGPLSSNYSDTDSSDSDFFTSHAPARTLATGVPVVPVLTLPQRTCVMASPSSSISIASDSFSPRSPYPSCPSAMPGRSRSPSIRLGTKTFENLNGLTPRDHVAMRRPVKEETESHRTTDESLEGRCDSARHLLDEVLLLSPVESRPRHLKHLERLPWQGKTFDVLLNQVFETVASGLYAKLLERIGSDSLTTVLVVTGSLHNDSSGRHRINFIYAPKCKVDTSVSELTGSFEGSLYLRLEPSGVEIRQLDVRCWESHTVTIGAKDATVLHIDRSSTGPSMGHIRQHSSALTTRRAYIESESLTVVAEFDGVRTVIAASAFPEKQLTSMIRQTPVNLWSAQFLPNVPRPPPAEFKFLGSIPSIGHSCPSKSCLYCNVKMPPISNGSSRNASESLRSVDGSEPLQLFVGTRVTSRLAEGKSVTIVIAQQARSGQLNPSGSLTLEGVQSSATDEMAAPENDQKSSSLSFSSSKEELFRVRSPSLERAGLRDDPTPELGTSEATVLRKQRPPLFGSSSLGSSCLDLSVASRQASATEADTLTSSSNPFNSERTSIEALNNSISGEWQDWTQGGESSHSIDALLFQPYQTEEPGGGSNPENIDTQPKATNCVMETQPTTASTDTDPAVPVEEFQLVTGDTPRLLTERNHYYNTFHASPRYISNLYIESPRESSPTTERDSLPFIAARCNRITVSSSSHSPHCPINDSNSSLFTTPTAIGRPMSSEASDDREYYNEDDLISYIYTESDEYDIEPPLTDESRAQRLLQNSTTKGAK